MRVWLGVMMLAMVVRSDFWGNKEEIRGGDSRREGDVAESANGGDSREWNKREEFGGGDGVDGEWRRWQRWVVGR